MSNVTTRPSMRKAINRMCQECIYDSHDNGTWRQQVERCTAPKCPLFELRPRPRPLPPRGDQPSGQEGPKTDQDGGIEASGGVRVAMTGKRAANAILGAHRACQGGMRDG